MCVVARGGLLQWTTTQRLLSDPCGGATTQPVRSETARRGRARVPVRVLAHTQACTHGCHEDELPRTGSLSCACPRMIASMSHALPHAPPRGRPHDTSLPSVVTSLQSTPRVAVRNSYTTRGTRQRHTLAAPARCPCARTLAPRHGVAQRGPHAHLVPHRLLAAVGRVRPRSVRLRRSPKASHLAPAETEPTATPAPVLDKRTGRSRRTSVPIVHMVHPQTCPAAERTPRAQTAPAHHARRGARLPPAWRCAAVAPSRERACGRKLVQQAEDRVCRLLAISRRAKPARERAKRTQPTARRHANALHAVNPHGRRARPHKSSARLRNTRNPPRAPADFHAVLPRSPRVQLPDSAYRSATHAATHRVDVRLFEPQFTRLCRRHRCIAAAMSRPKRYPQKYHKPATRCHFSDSRAITHRRRGTRTLRGQAAVWQPTALRRADLRHRPPRGRFLDAGHIVASFRRVCTTPKNQPCLTASPRFVPLHALPHAGNPAQPPAVQTTPHAT